MSAPVGPALLAIKKRLREVGYNSRFLGAFIPEWWTPEAESDPETLAHLKFSLASQIGLDVEAILERDAIEPVTSSGHKFRRSKNLMNDEPPNPNLAFYSRVAETIATMQSAVEEVPGDPEQIRAEILSEPGADFVSLPGLLEYCWRKNIAVCNIEQFAGIKKGAQALVYPHENRRIIIISEKIPVEQPARASFFIAHELGHIALGHVSDDVVLMDDEISDAEAHNVEDEISADRFALQLLSGGLYNESWAVSNIKARPFARRAKQFGFTKRIDPGHVLLRYGRSHPDYWALASKALKTLAEGETASPRHVVNQLVRERLDFSLIGRESQALLDLAIPAD